VRVATLDIGTNSVLLLIAESGSQGPIPLLERATITRLGEGVDRTRTLSAAARARTLACIRDYAEDIRRFGVTRAAAVGTSALRDAFGGREFAAELAGVLGFAPQIIAGEREAALTFRGALSGLDIHGDVTVFDVGGGSTELIHGAAAPTEASIFDAVSLDIGSVRLFERHVRTDPASAFEMERVRGDILAALASAPPSRPGTLVGVAGTVTTLAALALALDEYDAGRVHGTRLTLQTARDLAQSLAALTVAERRALRGLDPRRADVIVAGAAIVLAILERSGASELVVSDRGVRFGLAEELLTNRD